MKILKAYKFQLMPNGEQLRKMRRFAGLVRKVWNLALAQQEALYASGGNYAGAFSMNYWLKDWKADLPYLAEAPAQVLQQAMTNLDRGYAAFFKGISEHPTFKKKGKSNDSFRYPQGFNIDQPNYRVFLPKLGWIRYRNSRDVIGKAKNITVSCKAGKWYAAIQTEQEVDVPVPDSSSAIGIDMGIARFATLSSGEYIDPVNSLKQHQVRLARYQRAMSRKKKFSNNWHKAKAKVSHLHTRIWNIRQDFLHKTTTQLSKTHALIVIEDLKVRNMSKSAAGHAVLAHGEVAQSGALVKREPAEEIALRQAA